MSAMSDKLTATDSASDSATVSAMVSAVRSGLGRAFGQPRLILVLWLVNVLAALPLATVLGASIHQSTRHSLVSEQLATGFDTVWHSEWDDAAGQGPAGGLASTFDPSMVGVGAFLDNLEAWWSGSLLQGGASGFPGLMVAGLLFVLVWAFLLGGVIQRFARPTGFEGQVFSQVFFGHCGRFFGRFVRLALASGVVYLAIYALGRAYFGALRDWTHDVTSERTVLLWVLVGAAGVVALLMIVRLLFDLTKVIVVLEDRHGVLLTLLSATRVVVRRPLPFLALYGTVALLWLLALAGYSWVAPTAGPAGWLGLILAFLLAQVLLALKIGLRLSLLAGEMDLYRQGLQS